jgi:hypothetical protein
LTQILISKKFEKETVFESSVLAWIRSRIRIRIRIELKCCILIRIHSPGYIEDLSFFRSGKGFAEDYFLDAKSQCAGKRGACPDR